MFPFLWKGADGVVAFEPCGGMHSWNMVCERPPRLRRIRRLRGIFLYGAATPPHEEGTTARLNISQSHHCHRKNLVALGFSPRSGGFATPSPSRFPRISIRR